MNDEKENVLEEDIPIERKIKIVERQMIESGVFGGTYTVLGGLIFGSTLTRVKENGALITLIGGGISAYMLANGIINLKHFAENVKTIRELRDQAAIEVDALIKESE